VKALDRFPLPVHCKAMPTRHVQGYILAVMHWHHFVMQGKELKKRN
jgi:hypothetical protein